MTFEEYLQLEHAEEYMGTDDDMPDAFSEWVTDLSMEDIFDYAESWKLLG